MKCLACGKEVEDRDVGWYYPEGKVACADCHGLPYEGEEGLVERCGSVTVWHGPSAGMTKDYNRQWVTKCMTHGHLAFWAELPGDEGAMGMAWKPEDWCDRCHSDNKRS